MIICSWNIRGLNQYYKIKELDSFLKKNKIDLVGYYETRVKVNKASKIQWKFGHEWVFITNYNYAENGRIWVGWKTAKVDVQAVYTNEQVIHCQVQDKNTTFSSYITFVYGKHTVADRRPLWEQLREIKGTINTPWLILGDFNNILHVEDRLNGAPVHHIEMQDFQQCLDDIEVGQLTYTAIGTVYMPPECSDHAPILINTKVHRAAGKRPYRLLTGYAIFSIVRKLKILEEHTRELHKTYSAAEMRIQGLKEQLKITQEALNEDHFNQHLIEEEKALLLQIEMWDNIHEKILRQKSRATWIHSGDKNSKYFFAQLKSRQSRNTVKCIFNEQNQKLTDPALIQQEFQIFFLNLLGQAAPVMPGNMDEDGMPIQNPPVAVGEEAAGAGYAAAIQPPPLIGNSSVSMEAVRLRLFPYSLTGEATAWLDDLPSGSITT
ncbi:uncharacterized protein LOC132643841 [Lycium barbarum]|uniref:uncharacterized protein LOC132643841 n=1 Tax=Lycium barbarum TaxID=112863 RepID=UPI00293F475D|nr:uncharacterized protein LOC132643841 [Lycium barbarum]